jgi:hypothetical protein
LVVSDSVLVLLALRIQDLVLHPPDVRQSIARELRAHQQVPSLVSRQRLRIANGRLEQLLKLGLVLCRDEGEPYAWDLSRLGGDRGRDGRAPSERVRHLRRGHARGLRPLGLRGWLLLLRWGSSLELLLLRSCRLLELALLARIARELRLLRLWLLLPEPLRLAGEASVLRLHWTSPKACRLGSKSALKAALLSIWLLWLLLLAILRLAWSGAVAAP